MAKSKMKRKRAPKSVLKLPDLEQSKSAVLNSLTSPSSQRTYDHAIREFIEWYCSEPRLAFNKTVVTRYRISLEQQHYASTTINLRLAAVRRLAYEAADCGLLSADLAAGIRRVKGAKRLGMPVGNWLSAEQGTHFLCLATLGRIASTTLRPSIVKLSNVNWIAHSSTRDSTKLLSCRTMLQRWRVRRLGLKAIRGRGIRC